jgi:hypothetical protein
MAANDKAEKKTEGENERRVAERRKVTDPGRAAPE